LNAIVRFDCNGRIIDFDKTAEKLFGFSRFEVVGRGLCETILPVRGADGRDMAKSVEDLCQSPEDHKSIVLEAVKKNGDRLLMHWACCPFIDHNTGKRAVCAVGTDLSARDRASDALRESELRLARIIDFLPDPTFVIDRAGVVQTWNRAMTELTGVPAEKIIGKGNYEYSTCFYGKRRPILIDLVLREDQHIEGKYRKLVRRDDAMTAESYITINGTRRYVQGKAARLYDSSGRVTGAIETFADMTGRKRMEEELERHSEQLGKLVEERTAQLRERERLAAIGETAAMVGHDLRNPLQAMTNALYLLGEEVASVGAAKGQVCTLIEMLEDNMEYMDKIVSDLQDFAKPLTVVKEYTPAAALLVAIVDSLGVPPSVRVTMDISERLQIYADALLIRRAFTNIINNAVQAMPDGGTLTISGAESDGRTEIRVSDTGAGIPAENLKNLFRPLFTSKSKGMGMGLAVSRRVIKAHGGSIEVETTPNKGTTFTVRLHTGPAQPVQGQ
jgi:PAS domain S-box-containing protein